MDWYLEPSDTTAVRVLRGELERYLRRHSEPGSDVEGAVIAFSELVTNALQHTSGPVWISVDWSRPSPVLSVHDLGPGFTLPSSGSPPVAIGGFGLYVASQVAQELQAASKRAGGSKVTAVLPVRRRAERSFDPPRRRAGALPTVEEAKPDGNFGRESFLRALAVQLAQTLELTEGPEAAQAAVAQVGTDVGGSMEEAYRRARGITERLGPAQMADLYVTLKRAIDGDFYVIEANEERVVLGNRACPFGEAVKRSPALCRMTSSVFGGIAARNAGGAAVQLEERIAVGDPECRVTVWLKEPPESARELAHFYGRMPTDRSPGAP